MMKTYKKQVLPQYPQPYSPAVTVNCLTSFLPDLAW